MKLLNSTIFDILNSGLKFIQEKLDNIRQNSLILSNIDYFILLFVILTLIVSTVAQTNFIGIISAFVPILVIIKMLITKGEKIELERWNFYLLIYLLICLISNFTSSMPAQSFYGFMKTVIYFAFYFGMCQFLKNNKKFIPVVLCAISILISVESFIGLFQNYIGVENISTWQDTSYVNAEDILARVYGTLQPYNPNLFGGWLIAGFPALIYLCGKAISNKKTISACIWGICSLICAYTIFLTGCRGAYLALFTIFLGVLICIYKKIKAYTGILAGLIVLFIALNQGIFKRLMSIFILRGDSSTSFRMNVYNSAIQMFHDNPICGIGVGNKVFREIYGLYMLSGFDALSCYSVFLEIAVESGIFALLAYILFIGSILINAVKKYIKTPDILVFISAISIIAVMIHGIFDTVYFRPQIQYVFWTMTAVLTASLREDIINSD